MRLGKSGEAYFIVPIDELPEEEEKQKEFISNHKEVEENPHINVIEDK